MCQQTYLVQVIINIHKANTQANSQPHPTQFKSQSHNTQQVRITAKQYKHPPHNILTETNQHQTFQSKQIKKHTHTHNNNTYTVQFSSSNQQFILSFVIEA